ncbi:MAG: methylenetetrahydrofolate reductase [Deltaproteobacteria bacterium]|nr:methylenetetrahydrofolate reductase [Deltaproteobacteria bacterium]
MISFVEKIKTLDSRLRGNDNVKIITTELTPPRGSGVKKFIKTAALLSKHVDALNITDNQRAVMRMSSIASSAILLQNGFEPICQIVCRDKNSLALQSDLIGASALGIKNILALTGDPVQGGDNPQAKKVFEFESTKLLKMLFQLNQGFGWNGTKLNQKTGFVLGATINPTSPNSDVQLRRFEQKLEGGARFFQTQATFDVDLLQKFIKKVEHFKVPIIVGVIMMKSFETAQFLNERVLGIRVPERFITALKNSKKPEETGVHLAAHLVKDFLEVTQGVHIMAVRREHRVPDIIQLAKNMSSRGF